MFLPPQLQEGFSPFLKHIQKRIPVKRKVIIKKTTIEKENCPSTEISGYAEIKIT